VVEGVEILDASFSYLAEVVSCFFLVALGGWTVRFRPSHHVLGSNLLWVSYLKKRRLRCCIDRWLSGREIDRYRVGCGRRVLRRIVYCIFQSFCV